MPRFDGTGPLGGGPRTGRVLGNCASENEDNDLNSLKRKEQQLKDELINVQAKIAKLEK